MAKRSMTLETNITIVGTWRTISSLVAASALIVRSTTSGHNQDPTLTTSASPTPIIGMKETAPTTVLSKTNRVISLAMTLASTMVHKSTHLAPHPLLAECSYQT